MMNNPYPIVPVILALGAIITGAVFWVTSRRRHEDSELDAVAFLLVGIAWMVIGIVFDHTNLGSFGGVLILSGMGIGLTRRLAKL
jgi:nitrogen fixation-related uncharacterized protein